MSAATSLSAKQNTNAVARRTPRPWRRDARPNRRGEATCPSASAPPRNTAAFATISPTLPKAIGVPALAAAMTPLSTARMTSPNTSSTTAAPRITRASGVVLLPRSCSTRAVIPTLVAVRVAPRKAWAYQVSPGRSRAPTSHPSTNGAATPSVATSTAVAPTFSMARTVDSRPTSKSSRITPIWASASRVSFASSPCSPVIPSRPRLPRITPAISSPSTAGCRARVARSPPSLAAASMIARAPRTTAREVLPSGAGVTGGRSGDHRGAAVSTARRDCPPEHTGMVAAIPSCLRTRRRRFPGAPALPYRRHATREKVPAPPHPGRIEQHAARPAVDIELPNQAAHHTHPGTLLSRGHREGEMQGRGALIVVIGIDADGLGELAGRAGEVTQDEDPALVVSRRHEFLGHEIHPVMQAGHHAELRGPVMGVDLLRLMVLHLEDDRRRVRPREPVVDARGQRAHARLVFLVLADAGASRGGDLNECELPDPLRLELEETLHGTQPLLDSLGVVQPVHPDPDRVS